MPAVEIQDRRQFATLWRLAGYDNYGNPTVAAPREIKVRSELGIAEAIDAQATPIAVTSTLFVAERITMGSIIRRGKLRDVPVPPNALEEVVNYEEVPDLKGRQFQRTITLRRYSETLPAIDLEA